MKALNISAHGLTEKLQDQRVWCELPRGKVITKFPNF